MTGVLFVCTGNICRSPTAEGVFRKQLEIHGLSQSVRVDSAGTGSWHVGEPPDERSSEAASRRGVHIVDQRARQVAPEDFEAFDLILAMDQGHYGQLQRLCPEKHQHRLRLFLDFAPTLGIRDVPDPYYGGPEGFENVLDMIEAASEGLLAEVREKLSGA